MLRQTAGALAVIVVAYVVIERFGQVRQDKEMFSLRKKKLGRYTVGLSNRANDCFANSNLQALAAITVLYQWCLDQESKSQAGVFCSAVGEMFRDLNEPVMKPKTLNAWKLLSVLERIHKSRISRNQHDAHELLHLILETLENELKSEEAKHGFPFRGETVNVIRCVQCGYSPPSKHSSFLVLSLMVPQTKTASLPELLNNMSKPEFIDDYGCGRCRLMASHNEQLISQYGEDIEAIPEEVLEELPSNRSRISKFEKFHWLPPVLTIQLSRSIYSASDQPWGGGASRNSCKVSFPELLDLFAEPESSSTDPLKGVLNKKKKIYRLVAMIRHKGTHSTGHYECFRRKDFSWFNQPVSMSAPTSPTASSGHLRSTSNSNLAPVRSSSVPVSINGDSPRQGNQETSKHSDLPDTPSSSSEYLPFPSSHASPSTSISEAMSKPGAFSSATLTPVSNYTWWRISDDRVWECNTKDVLQEESGAYLLFYQEINQTHTM